MMKRAGAVSSTPSRLYVFPPAGISRSSHPTSRPSAPCGGYRRTTQRIAVEAVSQVEGALGLLKTVSRVFSDGLAVAPTHPPIPPTPAPITPDRAKPVSRVAAVRRKAAFVIVVRHIVLVLGPVRRAYRAARAASCGRGRVPRPHPARTGTPARTSSMILRTNPIAPCTERTAAPDAAFEPRGPQARPRRSAPGRPAPLRRRHQRRLRGGVRPSSLGAPLGEGGEGGGGGGRGPSGRHRLRPPPALR